MFVRRNPKLEDLANKCWFVLLLLVYQLTPSPPRLLGTFYVLLHFASRILYLFVQRKLFFNYSHVSHLHGCGGMAWHGTARPAVLSTPLSLLLPHQYHEVRCNKTITMYTTKDVVTISTHTYTHTHSHHERRGCHT